MSKAINLSGKPFHFIGIGGIGMSALAHILAERKVPVSGSDLRSSLITERLQSLGAQIFTSQEAANLDIFAPRDLDSAKSTPGSDVPQIICSTAISSNNLEYQAAKTKGYPIFHRSDLLAALIADYHSIAVAGTHGKTTTSSLISYVLLHAGLDPTIIVGGEVETWSGNARLGQSRYLVAEADESDGSLAKHAPQIGIVTNIELDHPDHYHSLEQVIETFQVFAHHCGVLIANVDCAVVQKALQPQISYSLESQSADYTVTQVEYSGTGSRAIVWERGTQLGELSCPLLGKHNLSNTLAAVAVGRHLGLEFATLAAAIATFPGTKRRFEYRGAWRGISLYDDYAHHPSEISVTLAAARLKLAESQAHRLVAIFQPHRYSRTQTFLKEFGDAFTDADVAIVTDIYSAGEANPHNITGEQVAAAISQPRHLANGSRQPQVIYHPGLDSLCQMLREILQPGDLVLCLGAGNVNQVIPQLLEFP